MDLDELRTWYDRLRAELDERRFEVIREGPIAGRPEQSACLSLDGPDRMGALIVRDTGEERSA
ncbi:hypothetical protein ACIHIX_04835 [Streptomyces sp. NPDC051913]|uniref:hypothetical protein n=1 Tax=Streptomyces sp. NPDC051913 TaxID=3365676 RepID=UPI0037D85F37